MIVGEDAFGAGVVIDPVRSFTDVDFVDELQRRWIKHRDFVFTTIAGETVFELGGECNAVNSGCVRDCPDQLAAVRIDYVHLRAVRQVQASRIAIDRYVIEAAIAWNWITRLDFVSGSCLKQRQRYRNSE